MGGMARRTEPSARSKQRPGNKADGSLSDQVGEYLHLIFNNSRKLPRRKLPKDKEAARLARRVIHFVAVGWDEDAYRACKRIIEIEPDYSRAHVLWGAKLFEDGLFDDALAAAERGVALEPDYSRAHLLRGRVLYEMGRIEEAISAFDHAAKLEPDYSLIHAAHGAALADNGRPAEGLAAYDRAIEVQPDYDVAHAARGVALFDLGRYEEALAACDRALDINPNNRRAYEFKNEVLSKLHENDGETHYPGYTGARPPPRPDDASRDWMREHDLNTAVKKAKAENLARGKSRLPATHQLATYRALVQTLDLLNPELSQEEGLTRARRLVRAYERVRDRRPKFRDRNEQLQAAFSIINRFEYRQKLKRQAVLKLAAG
jgi:tetratricopeptide (TPR) repeat protein